MHSDRDTVIKRCVAEDFFLNVILSFHLYRHLISDGYLATKQIQRFAQMDTLSEILSSNLGELVL